MRILPLAIYLVYAQSAERIDAAMKCSRLTHGHPRSQLACALFVEVAAALVRGDPITDAVSLAQAAMAPTVANQYPTEQPIFERLLSPTLVDLNEDEISGSGYVIHCLESSLWCALRAKSYSEGVLQAVNLGEDTDTTGAITGGLLGLVFGVDAIPGQWRNQLARQQDLLDLCARFQIACEGRWEADRIST